MQPCWSQTGRVGTSQVGVTNSSSRHIHPILQTYQHLKLLLKGERPAHWPVGACQEVCHGEEAAACQQRVIPCLMSSLTGAVARKTLRNEKARCVRQLLALPCQLLEQVVEVGGCQQSLPLRLPPSNLFLNIGANVLRVKNDREKLVDLLLKQSIVCRQLSLELAKNSEQVDEAIVTDQWLPRLAEMPQHLGEPKHGVDQLFCQLLGAFVGLQLLPPLLRHLHHEEALCLVERPEQGKLGSDLCVQYKWHQ